MMKNAIGRYENSIIVVNQIKENGTGLGKVVIILKLRRSFKFNWGIGKCIVWWVITTYRIGIIVLYSLHGRISLLILLATHSIIIFQFEKIWYDVRHIFFCMRLNWIQRLRMAFLYLNSIINTNNINYYLDVNLRGRPAVID